MLDPKVWWPLFPFLLLVVVVCLTWAVVAVVRGTTTTRARWLQVCAFGCYFLAAVAAIASERGVVSANLHRPFSFLTQVCLVVALVHHWNRGNRTLLWLNGTAWAAILSDTALHFLLRH